MTTLNKPQVIYKEEAIAEINRIMPYVKRKEAIESVRRKPHEYKLLNPKSVLDFSDEPKRKYKNYEVGASFLLIMIGTWFFGFFIAYETKEGWAAGGLFLIYFFLGLILPLLINTVLKVYSKSHNKRVDAEYDTEYKKILDKKNKEIELHNQELIKKMKKRDTEYNILLPELTQIESFLSKSFIPKGFQNTIDLNGISSKFHSLRADTLKEAINLYVDEYNARIDHQEQMYELSKMQENYDQKMSEMQFDLEDQLVDMKISMEQTLEIERRKREEAEQRARNR